MAIWLILQIVYTPLHLSLELHSDETCFSPTISALALPNVVSDDDHDENHDRHPAQQHKFKTTASARTAIVALWLAPAAEWVDIKNDIRVYQPFVLSGLSPPHLHCRWQFLFRAALPVRAPSLLS